MARLVCPLRMNMDTLDLSQFYPDRIVDFSSARIDTGRDDPVEITDLVTYFGVFHQIGAVRFGTISEIRHDVTLFDTGVDGPPGGPPVLHYYDITGLALPLGALEALSRSALMAEVFRGNDRINGSPENDILRGFDGNDIIKAGAGDDLVNGAANDDAMNGGLGRDTLVGGLGRDTFNFNSVSESRPGAAHRDTIFFSHADGDAINLVTIDANTHTAGNQAFRFIGSSTFGHHDGELRLAGNILQGDVNGDGRADIEIRVIGTLARGDIDL